MIDQLESSIRCGSWQARLDTSTSKLLNTIFDVSTRRWNSLCGLEEIVQRTIDSVLSFYYLLAP